MGLLETRRIAGGLAAATFLFSLSFAACSNTSGDPQLQSTVSPVAGHDHPASITHRQFNSGIRHYFLYESSGHAHTFELTLDQVAYLALGFPIVVESSYAALHNHAVLIQKLDF